MASSPNSNQSRSPDPYEHVDSPLRKRPKLDGDGGGGTTKAASPPAANRLSTPASAQEAALPVAPVTPKSMTRNVVPPSPTSPSHNNVTLNLRTPDLSPISKASKPLSIQGDVSTEDDTRETTPVDGTLMVTEDSPGSSTSSDVVEIEVDEMDSAYDDEPMILHIPDDLEDDAVVAKDAVDQILDQFPSPFHNYMSPRSPMDRAKGWAERVSQGTIDLEALTHIHTWLDSLWLQYATEVSNGEHDLYTDDEDFWISLASIYWKILVRRNAPVMLFGRNPQSSHPPNLLKHLTSFLLSYLRLCGSMIEQDIRNLRRSAYGEASPTLICSKHVKNMNAILSPVDQISFWKHVNEYRSRASDARRTLAFKLLTDQHETLPQLGELVRLLLSDLALAAKARVELDMGIIILCNVCQILASHNSSSERGDCPTEYSAVFESLKMTAQWIMACLETAVSKETTCLPNDLISRLTGQLGDLIGSIALIDNEYALELIGSEMGSVEESVADYLIPEIGGCVSMRLAWRSVTHGRMELRVAGIEAVTKVLLKCWRGLNNQGRMAMAALQLISRWLLNSKVIEYLCGAESHPQLISRSEHTFGFLLVTSSWTSPLTDAVWTAGISNTDPRIVTALWHVLASIAGSMDPEVLSGFCRKVAGLSLSDISNGMLVFLDNLGEAIAVNLSHSPQQYDLDTFEDPVAAYITLVCQCAEPSPTDANKALLATAHQLALQMVQRLSLAVDDSEHRTRTYIRCIDNLESSDALALGSVRSVNALLSCHNYDDLPQLFHDTELLPTLARGICKYIARVSEAARTCSIAPSGLDSFLDAFLRLACRADCPPLAAELEVELWRHLVGDLACNDESRDLAWAHFAATVTPSSTCDFVARCIDTFVPQLSPDIFTLGALDTLYRCVPLVKRAARDQDPRGPCTDALWKIVTDARFLALAERATSYLTEIYLDRSFFQDHTSQINLRRVSTIHTELMSHCVQQLASASATIKSSMEAGGDEFHLLRPEYTAEDMSDGHVRFTRILGFMAKFINEIKRRPEFKEQTEVHKTTSVASTNQTSDNQVQLLYQVFAPGESDCMRRLQIDATATLEDLRVQLCSLLNFRGVRVIFQGDKLQLEGNVTDTVDFLEHKGLLLVRNDDTRVLPDLIALSAGMSAAERAVMVHQDQIYTYLDLKGQLSCLVARFLDLFPPRPRFRKMVLDETTDVAMLFPPDNVIKTQHSLVSLGKELEIQIQAGARDDTFVLRGVHLLSTSLVQLVEASASIALNRDSVNIVISNLLAFLRERPSQDSAIGHIAPDTDASLWSLLEDGMSGNQPSPIDLNTVYACLLEYCLHKGAIWSVLTGCAQNLSIHQWLLVDQEPAHARERVRNMIRNMCSGMAPLTAISSAEVVRSYWQILSPLITLVVEEPLKCDEFLQTIESVFDLQAPHFSEAELRTVLVDWTSLLEGYMHVERPAHPRDALVNGVTKLLAKCVTHLKSFKKPINHDALSRLFLDKYLFPRIYADDSPLPLTKVVQQPVLDSETRRIMYEVVLQLSEDMPKLQFVVQQLDAVILREAKTRSVPFHSDRSNWLRSPLGYSGLRNLTNTCYMNSLITQLFMNRGFRSFMLNLEAGGDRKLLRETQNLFANMQSSYGKYADTYAFASSIRPYDSEHIDIGVQMDVDEFYNLLFDRWESEMPSARAKQQFRSYYGGQSVTQIKSCDCEHVSERTEPYFSVPLEVKGKQGLLESLNAYIEGDTMEGDNKYKCETCGGKFVNAVKRTCLKDLPDNLIFHLKRFDFDLTTFIRHKINDEFVFPRVVDMKPYTLECINDPDTARETLMYELAGVLVHSGNAESGHYYSYMELSDGASATPHRWAEFNDMEVSPFEVAKMADQCFGGETIAGNFVMAKQWNAYMLFYRRVAHGQGHEVTNSQLDRAGPSQEVERSIALANQDCIRQYCLFDPAHAKFVRNVLKDFKLKSSEGCSPDHYAEDRVIGVVMEHLGRVFSRVKDLGEFRIGIAVLKESVAGCGACCKTVLDWMLERQDICEEMILASPIDVRFAWSSLLITAMKTLRELDSAAYGLVDDATSEDVGEHSASPIVLAGESRLMAIIGMLRSMMPRLGRYIRAWDSYYWLLNVIASLGREEVGALLASRMFGETLQLLHLWLQWTKDGASDWVAPDELCELLRRNRHRPVPHAEVTRFICVMLSHLDTDTILDTTDPDERLAAYDPESRRYPILATEARPFYQSHPTHLTWFVAVVELWENVEPITAFTGGMNVYVDYWPGEIVREVLRHAKATKDGHSRMSDALCTCLMHWIEKWELRWCQVLLIMAEILCQEAPGTKTSTRLLELVARKAATLNQHAPAILDTRKRDHHGGCYLLIFFTRLALVTVADPHGPDGSLIRPHLDHVIDQAPEWAPPLLIFDTPSVRAQTELFLAENIFAAYPSPEVVDDGDASSSGDEVDLKEIDVTRSCVVRALFEACSVRLELARKAHFAAQIVQPTASVLQQCASWCDKLAAEEADGPLGELKNDTDEIVVEQFKEIKVVIDGWKFGFDTDETNNESDFGSDEMDDSDTQTEA